MKSGPACECLCFYCFFFFTASSVTAGVWILRRHATAGDAWRCFLGMRVMCFCTPVAKRTGSRRCVKETNFHPPTRLVAHQRGGLSVGKEKLGQRWLCVNSDTRFLRCAPTAASSRHGTPKLLNAQECCSGGMAASVSMPQPTGNQIQMLLPRECSILALELLFLASPQLEFAHCFTRNLCDICAAGRLWRGNLK